jgi:uncharacterized membrane protein
MNSSIDGTSSPTSLSIVLYCESSRVHAGEYLFSEGISSTYVLTNNAAATHSDAGTESRTYARSRYSKDTMIPNNVANSPYFSRSALFVYSLTSSSKDNGVDMLMSLAEPCPTWVLSFQLQLVVIETVFKYAIFNFGCYERICDWK